MPIFKQKGSIKKNFLLPNANVAFGGMFVMVTFMPDGPATGDCSFSLSGVSSLSFTVI